jgi:CHAT domain-containing protein
LLVRTSYELFRRTGKKQYLQDAYGLIASAKYAFLNKGIIEPETSVVIKSSLLSEERNLIVQNIKSSIPLLSESKLMSLLPAIPKSVEASSLSQIDLAKHVMDTVTFDDLKTELNSEKAALIDFYFHDKELFTIAISKEGFDVTKRTIPVNLISWIKNLKKSQLEMSSVKYSCLSNKIYRSILDSALMLIPKGTNRLIISPDAFLQEIAWDALVTDTTNNKTFKSLSYLMTKYTIRTVMTPVHITNQFKKAKDDFYGIAPNFENSKRFSSIPFSTTLVSSKAEAFDGIFKKTISNDPIDANILHITSHVTTDPVHPYNSTIHVGEVDSVTIANLSNAKIKANLIILNGCQTGNGRYVQSEGTISMARAFYLLGAKSVLTTLWSVDDKATADVLKIWYDNIENGEDLDNALRKAKLEFISNAGSEELAYPFYWAGLQLTGSSKPIVKTNKAAILLVPGLFLFMAIVLSIFLRFRLKDRTF